MQIPEALTSPFTSDPTSFFVLGACLQALLAAFLPVGVALLSTAFLLAAKVLTTLLPRCPATLSTKSQDQVHRGRWTAQLSQDKGSDTVDGSEAEVVCFVLGVSSNHPQGKAAPGFGEVGRHFRLMWKEAEADRKKAGYLGRSIGLAGTTTETSTTLIVLSYWKDVESLRAFAQGPAHRAGWDWWNRTVKSHPHIGIMHEVFAAPKGHWENIYVNMKPFGMGQMELPGGEGADQLRSALVQAKGPQWKSMLGRMNRVDTFEGNNAEED